MPVLTPEQLEAIRKIIRDASTALAISTTGLQVTEADLQRLVAEGWVRAEDLQNVVLNSFELGRLKAALPQLQTMTWDQAQDHMRRHPVEMTAEEKLAAEIAQQRAGDYCRNLGADLEKQLAGIVTEVSEARAEDMRALIREEVSQAVVDRKTSSELTTALRDATEDWGRDWKRVARTEMQLAHQQGHLENVRRRSGDEALMAKIPSPDACDDCRRLYLDKDGRPAVHPISWWDAQGISNYGRARRDWKPVIGAVHPWCFPPGQQVTTGRGQVPIEQVLPGELALTAEGRWRRVRQVYRHYFNGDLVETTTAEARVRSTPNHLFRGVVDWQSAEKLGEGDQVRRFPMLREAEAHDQPSVVEQKCQLALVLLGLDPAGVPVAAVDLDGHLAFLPAEVDKVTPPDRIVDDRDAETPQAVSDASLERGMRASGLTHEPPADLFLRLGAPPTGPVGGGGQRFALLGGRELLADLHRFAARALLDPSLLESLDDGATAHAKLAGYRIYGQVLLQVETNDRVDVKRDASSHDAMVAAHTATVKSSKRAPWAGYVYNLGVEDDESYVVEGFAVHNCRCELVEVPKGWGFDEQGDLVPLEKSRGGEDLIKAKAYGGPYIGPKGGKWADPQHTIPWHEKLTGVIQARTPEEKAQSIADLAVASHEHYRAAVGAMMRKMPEEHWRENVEIVRNPEHPEHAETKRALEDAHQRIINRINPSKAEQKKQAAAAAKEREEQEYEAQGVEVEEGTPPSKLRGKMVWLYHGTSDKLLRHIRKEGLRTAAEHGRKQVNVGSTAMNQADPNYYAQHAAYHTGGEPVILRVLVRGDDLQRDPDDQDISSGDYQYVVDRVTPEQIMEIDGKRVATLKKSHSLQEAFERLEKARKLHYRTTFAGLPISIENRKGSIRRWYDPHAKREGQTKMQAAYGYVRMSEATDGEHVDVYLGPDETAPNAYVIHQMRAPDFKVYDEDKVILGVRSLEVAKKLYLAHYDDPRFLGSITTMPIEEFKQKLKTRRGELIKAFGGVAGLVGQDRLVGTMSTYGEPPKDRSAFAAHPVEGFYANPEVSRRQKRKRRKDRLPNVEDKPESLVAYQPGMAREKPVVDRGNPQDVEENRRRFEQRLTEQTNARQGIVLRPQDLR